MGAQVIAVANQKGGVGKTTTTLSLAAAFAHLGRRSLVLDLDPTASGTIHLACYPEDVEHTVYDVFMDESGAGVWDRAIVKDSGHTFDFVPGSVRLSELDMDLKERQGKGVILKNRIAMISDRYDYILLDCPPHVGVLQVNAIVASDLLIIPIQTDFLALHGLRLIFDTIRTLNRVLPEPVNYKALGTMFDQRAGACRRVLRLMQKKLGDRLFETVIHIDTNFREASAQGKVILERYPDSRGSREYVLLAKELIASEMKNKAPGK